MDENLKGLYNLYTEAGNTETPEEFVEAKAQLGDEAFYSYINSQIEQKKKDDTQVTPKSSSPEENGTPTNTSNNVIPEAVIEQLQGNATNQVDQRFAENTTQPLLPTVSSTESGSTLVEPLSESGSISPGRFLDTRNTQQTEPIVPVQNPIDSGLGTTPATTFNSGVPQEVFDQLGKYHNYDPKTGMLSNPKGIVPEKEVNALFKKTDDWYAKNEEIKKKNAEIEAQNKSLEFLAGKPTEEEGEKVFAEATYFDEANENRLSDTEIKKREIEEISKYADKEYLEPLPFPEKNVTYNTPATSPEDVKDSNEAIIAAEKRGDVIRTVDLGSNDFEKDEYGNYKFDILTDRQIKVYQDDISRQNKLREEENINRARHNYQVSFIPLQQSEAGAYLSEISKGSNELLTDEDYEKLLDKDSRRNLEIKLETERRLKEDKNLDYNTVLTQVAQEKQGLSSEQKVQTGSEYVQKMFIGDDDSVFNSYYADDTQDEKKFYQSYFSNPKNLSEFGEYMKDEGEALFDTSWMRRNNVSKNQEKRKELFESFIAWKGKDDRLDFKFNQDALRNAEQRLANHRSKGDEDAVKKELAKIYQYEARMKTASLNVKAKSDEFENAQQFYSKTDKENLEKEDFKIRVNKGEFTANYLNHQANVLLGISTSLQNAATGILRFGATPFGKGNVNDAIDILSEPISFGNIDIARISDNIITYSKGKEMYKEINGSMYQVGNDGKIFRPNKKVDKSELTEFDRSVEYNFAGITFTASKMLADIFITRGVGRGVVALESASALALSKRIISVYGAETQFAKQAANYARLIKGNPTAIMVRGWTNQMYDDNYIAAKNGGIESHMNRFIYAFTMSNALAQLQRINPDTNFLKAFNSESKTLVRALMENNTQKALISVQSLGNKIATNTKKELLEENFQQGTQDGTNFIINIASNNKNLQVSNTQAYKDTFFATVGVTFLASLIGGSARSAEVGGRKIDLTQLTRNEIATELARTNEGIALLQNFRDTAYFESQQNEADKLLAELKERKKIIDKIPDSENYSTETINQVIPILQEIDKKKAKLNSDDGTFKNRIEQEVQTLSTEVNTLLDNDTKTEETAQPEQEQETEETKTTTKAEQSQQIETPAPAESGVKESPEQIQQKIKNKSLFKDGGLFANILGGSGVDSVLSGHQEKDGIEIIQWSNPNTGEVDVVMTGTGNHDFVGYYRIYEDGKPTNKWSSKFENQSRNKANFKTMISGVQEILPTDHQYTENTSISTDGLRVWDQQLRNGYEITTDENGKIVTNEVMINGDSIVNDLGVEVEQGAFNPVNITTQEQYHTAKNAILPKLKTLGLDESNIRWDQKNNTIKIDLPVLSRSSKNNTAAETNTVTETNTSTTTTTAPKINFNGVHYVTTHIDENGRETLISERTEEEVINRYNSLNENTETAKVEVQQEISTELEELENRRKEDLAKYPMLPLSFDPEKDKEVTFNEQKRNEINAKYDAEIEALSTNTSGNIITNQSQIDEINQNNLDVKAGGNEGFSEASVGILLDDTGVTSSLTTNSNNDSRTITLKTGKGEIIGAISISNEIDGYEAISINVNSNYQGKGISKHLYNLALADAKSRGLKGLFSTDNNLKTEHKSKATRKNFKTLKSERNSNLNKQVSKRLLNELKGQDAEITLITDVSDSFEKEGATKYDAEAERLKSQQNETAQNNPSIAEPTVTETPIESGNKTDANIENGKTTKSKNSEIAKVEIDESLFDDNADLTEDADEQLNSAAALFDSFNNGETESKVEQEQTKSVSDVLTPISAIEREAKTLDTKTEAGKKRFEELKSERDNLLEGITKEQVIAQAKAHSESYQQLSDDFRKAEEESDADPKNKVLKKKAKEAGDKLNKWASESSDFNNLLKMKGDKGIIVAGNYVKYGGSNQNTITPPKQKSRVSSNGKYNVVENTSSDGRRTFELLDIDDNPVSISNKQKDVYVAEYINSQEYPETQLDLAEGMNENEVSQEVISKSENPKEIAQVIATTPRFDSQSVVGSKDWAIAQVIGGNNVSRASYIEADDKNNISNGIARTYFGKNKSGKTLDNIAQEASEQLSGDYSGDSVTIQDIVDFIKKYPNDPSKAERPNNPIYDAAVDRFIELTGQNPTKNLLDKLIPKEQSAELNLAQAEAEYEKISAEQQNQLNNEYDNWFNSLSLEQKTEELQKTFYENDSEGSSQEENRSNDNQSTPNGEGEGNQNVGNEETVGGRSQSQASREQEGIKFQTSSEADPKTNPRKFEIITKEAFDKLFDRLKKVFPKMGNIKATFDFNEFVEKAKAQGKKINFDADFQINPDARKEKQLAIINKTNPAPNSYNTWVDESEGQYAPIEFMKTAKGEIYGAVLPDGTMYFNPNKLNANTLIHEFGHIWERAMPTAFKKGLEIFKQTKTGKDLFAKLKKQNNYGQNDDKIWSEAMVMHIGNHGEWRTQNPRGKMAEFAQWLKDFFAKVGEVTGYTKRYGKVLTADERLDKFTEGVVGSLLGGKAITTEVNPSGKGEVKYKKPNVDFSILKPSDLNADGTIKAEVLAEIEAEEKAIIKEAKANGTYMKAPNGKATNLNEKQWVQTRTQRFKDWFGDWENDADNASKVVDENGEPMVVYHGTGAEFNEFDINTPIKNGRREGNGFYFIGDKKIAKKYASKNNIISAFLNIKNFWKGFDSLNENEKKIYLATKSDEEAYKKLNIDGIQIGGQIIAFSPAQIKSATGNIGTFNEDSNDIRFQIIGEQGATALDKAEESTHRLDNLRVAREMETANKTPKEIRLATGWERGVDGKWRYEIEDIKPFDNTVYNSWTKTFERVSNIGDWFKNHMDGKNPDYLRTLNDFAPSNDSIKAAKARGLDLSTLFQAYPELKKIKLTTHSDRSAKGQLIQNRGLFDFDFDTNNSTISLRSDLSPSEANDVLIHEIQHIIQEIEGFAKGGSIDNNLDAETTKQVYQVEKLIKDAIKLKSENEWLTDGKTISDLIQDEKWDHKNEIIEWAIKIADAGQSEIDLFLNDTPFRKYQRLAGETESRNAQTRANMSMAERQATLLSETEDVAREDQIVLLENAGVSFSIENNEENNSVTKRAMPKSTFAKVANATSKEGKEAGFAELQNSAWYNALTDNQKAKITVDNFHNTMIAHARMIQEEDAAKKREAVEKIREKGKEKVAEVKKDAKEKITEVKEKSKEKLDNERDKSAEKLETEKQKTKDKEESIKSAKEVIIQEINQALDTGSFQGTAKQKTLAAVAKRIAKAITLNQHKNILNYIKKVIANADYDQDLQIGRKLQNQIKKLAKSKTFSRAKTNVTVAQQFAKLNPNSVSDIKEYNRIAAQIINNLSALKVSKDFTLNGEDYKISNEEIENYTDKEFSEAKKLLEEKKRDDFQDKVDEGLIPDGMTYEEYTELTNTSNEEEFKEKQKELSSEKRKQIWNIAKSFVEIKRKELQDYIDGFVGDFSKEENKVLKAIANLDTSKLSLAQIVKLNDIINNIVTNHSFSDSQQIAYLEKSIRDFESLDNKMKVNGWIFSRLSTNGLNGLWQGIVSNDMLVEFIARLPKAAAELKRFTGISAISDGNARAKIEQQKIYSEYESLRNKLSKETGKNLNTTDSRIHRGIIARLLQNFGGSVEENNAEFIRQKKLIKDHFEKLVSLNKNDKAYEKQIKEGEVVKDFYEKYLADKDNLKDFYDGLKSAEQKANIKMVKFWVDKFAEYKNDFFEQSDMLNNTPLEDVGNYTATREKNFDGSIDSKEAKEYLENKFFGGSGVSIKPSGAKNNRVRQQKLGQNKLLNLDFDFVQNDVIHTNLHDLYTSEGVSVLRNFFANPEAERLLGGKHNYDLLKSQMEQTLQHQRGSLQLTNNRAMRSVNKALEVLQAKGARSALASFTQFPKQYISVAVNLFGNMGRDTGLIIDALKMSNSSEIFNKRNIGLRGGTKGGYNKESVFKQDDSNTRSRVSEASSSLYEVLMKPLEKSDVSIARTSWLAFYMKDLKKRNISYTTDQLMEPDYEVDEEAAAYAEQMVSRNQNANDASSMASAFKNSDTAMQFIKNVFLPFSTFSTNQRARMTLDFKNLATGSKEQKIESAKSLSATLAEQVTFNGIKIALNYALTVAGITVSKMLGLTDDDDEERAKKFLKDGLFNKLKMNTINDFFFTGMGSLTEKGFQTVTNQVFKWSGEKPPFFIFDGSDEPGVTSDWGVYSSGVKLYYNFGNDIYKLAKPYKTVIGGGYESKIVEIDGELPKEARNAYALNLLVDGMSLFGMSDQTVTTVNNRIRRDADKFVLAELGGKEIKITSPVNSAKRSLKFSKDILDKNKTFEQVSKEIDLIVGFSDKQKTSLKNSIKMRVEYPKIDAVLFDVKFTSDNEKKAQLLKDAYPKLNLSDGSNESEKVLKDMREIGGVGFTKAKKEYLELIKSK